MTLTYTLKACGVCGDDIKDVSFDFTGLKLRIINILYERGDVMNYQNDNFWRSIQDYLPLDNRISLETEPLEYFICVQNGKIHIDHYRVEQPKARIVLFHGV